MIQLRKVTWWGGIRNEFWSVKDIEHIENFQEHMTEYYYLFFNISLDTEKELLFRNKVTGQYFYSERYGVWNADLLEGLKSDRK